MPGSEVTISIESVRVPMVRQQLGQLDDLAESIHAEGLRHPICVWTDGTLISGERRLRAHFLTAGRMPTIRAIFVDTIEEAAKRLLADNGDEYLSRPMASSEMCRLWEVLLRLDEPAAARRADEARRRGVELRRQTMSGNRKPGRASGRPVGEEYALGVIAEPFGMSEATASRLWRIYNLSKSLAVEPERREQARKALAAIDAGQSSIWANYSALISKRRTAPVSVHKPAPEPEPAPAARQRAAWDRVLPQLEGLTAGLVELGAPHDDLTWDQVGPACTRLMSVRRELEKIIRKMKEKASA